MADNGSASASGQLPPPPQANAGAPGYENGQGNGNPAHMPPPPLHIPQNTNPIPTAITSPLGGGDKSGIISPTSGGPFARRAAPEPNKRALYVGGLDPRVTEDVLRQIFETTGHVQNVKIIPDKNAKGYNYGFVEYDDPGSAERAMQTLNGRRVHQAEIRVNWAYQSNNTNKEDTSNHFHIFVGDLSNEVNDEVLLQAFSAFGSVSEARVMWDMKTGRSRGYGFVAFRDRPEAEKALSSMDGEWLGSRAIRCNWANQKGQPSIAQQQAMQQMGMTPTTPYGHHHFPTHGVHSYDMIVNQTPAWQTTCYVGNLTPYTTQNDLVPLFQNFGFVVESRFQADRGFAFIKMDTHENAAMAICQLNGYNWGKDKTPQAQQAQFDPNQAYSPQSAQTPAYPGTPSTYFNQYGGNFGPGQQAAYTGAQAQSPAAYGGGPMGYSGPPSAGGYGRGQGPNPNNAQQWNQGQAPPQNFGNNGYSGYQG
ncbi:E3 ubiquitin-protein ligase pub1 [Podospora bellae-mahoneyi]|uniref:E3 ubiquitin-protein ligase pub1 n=1 Tax=Podospora bellae-mahoneyi TaxID=2093777 RepID=A0ABR0F8V7_9PEZI|nr:E3 ubiquitin-protein ligase pub1 [Podospora bellae-mahoneyi]